MKKKIIIGAVCYLLLWCLVSTCGSMKVEAKAKKKTVVRKYSEIYIGCKRSYKIKSLVEVLRKPELNNKHIKWSCSKKQVKVSKNKCKANKVGSYTLVGKLKKKKKVYKYKIPLKVLANEIPQIDSGVQTITIRSLNTEHIGSEYKNIDIADMNVVLNIQNRVNFVPGKYNFDKTYRPLSGNEGYILWFEYANGEILKISLNPGDVYRMKIYQNERGKMMTETSISCCYMSAKYNDFYQYIESLYVGSQGQK